MPARKAEADGRRILLDGGWVRMRPMTIDDLLALSDSEANLPAAIRAVVNGCIESKFDNGLPLGSQPLGVLTSILKSWNQREDDTALPPANGQPSV